MSHPLELFWDASLRTLTKTTLVSVSFFFRIIFPFTQSQDTGDISVCETHKEYLLIWNFHNKVNFSILTSVYHIRSTQAPSVSVIC